MRQYDDDNDDDDDDDDDGYTLVAIRFYYDLSIDQASIFNSTIEKKFKSVVIDTRKKKSIDKIKSIIQKISL